MPIFTHGKATKVWANGFDLTRYFREYNFAVKTDLNEVSTFGDTIKTFVTGQEDSTLSLNGYFNGDAGGADAVLSAAIGAQTNTVITISPDGNTTPGRRVLTGQAIESDYTISGGIAAVVEISAQLQSSGSIQPGVSLKEMGAETGAANQVGVSNAAGGTKDGGLMVLNVNANTMSANSIFTVQHSVDNATWVDLTSITVPTGSTGGFVSVVLRDTTVNQHLRAVSAYAGLGSCTSQISFIRY